MPRAALKTLIWVVTIGLGSGVWAIDPHMDPTVLPEGCPACHRGHGKPNSPMLPAAQTELCLSCHDSQVKLERRVLEGDVVRGGRSTFLSSVLANAFIHPMTDHAYSRREPGVVTCTSCHSPHRGLPQRVTEGRMAGTRKVSPRNPNRFEYEMCESCHGGGRMYSQSPLDISRLLSQSSRSYHPVKFPATESSPSIMPSLAGREINCTDCHDNNDPTGPRGPHGSGVRYLLGSDYNTVDGSPETETTYALCYSCHEREKVLNSASFPQHRMHIIDERASCATCHNPHGSIKNRALIRFGEETLPIGVSPSIQSGHLAFVSNVPGSGSCHLTCHGSDHSPKSYGGF